MGSGQSKISNYSENTKTYCDHCADLASCVTFHSVHEFYHFFLCNRCYGDLMYHGLLDKERFGMYKDNKTNYGPCSLNKWKI